MKTRKFRAVLGAGLASVVALASAQAQDAPYDILIRGGRIVDGTGNPFFNGDVAVKDGRIVAIGNLGDAEAARTIDATGRVVAPGFIDLHTHSDIPLLVDGDGQSAVRDGVTTDVIGEVDTVAPRDGLAPETVDGVTTDWITFAGYFDRVRRQGISINLISFVSSEQVRLAAMGYNPEPANPAEMARMEDLMRRSMEEGAWGLVTRFESGGPAHPEEVLQLAKIAASYGGTYNSHIGSEGYEMDAEIDFAIRVAEEAHIPVEIYHLKTRGQPLWGTIGKYIDEIEEARARGLDITANQYPYTAMQHRWSAFFPVWIREDGPDEFAAQLRDPATRQRIKTDPDFHAWIEEHGGWEGIYLTRAYSEESRPFEGMNVADIAERRGDADPADTAITVMADDGGQTRGVFVNMSEADVRRVMQLTWVAVGSDGAALNIDAPGVPHARSFATHSRILGHYVREEGVLTLEDAIRKMTSFPAQILGLKDRGQIREGLAADIVVFDPETVTETNTLLDSKHYSEGFDAVIVNGVVVVDHDRHTGARPGRVLYGAGYRGSAD
jgi:N-acyl-D-amino-acid deacylase